MSAEPRLGEKKHVALYENGASFHVFCLEKTKFESDIQEEFSHNNLHLLQTYSLKIYNLIVPKQNLFNLIF